MFPRDILGIIASYLVKPDYRLADWVDPFFIDKHYLSCNPYAIPYLEDNPRLIDYDMLCKNTHPDVVRLLRGNINRINWRHLSANPAAIPLLEENSDKIVWYWLSKNPAAIHLLEANPDKISWSALCENPSAIHLLEANQDKIDWLWLCRNPNAVQLLEANQHRINWDLLSQNPNAIHLLEANQDKINWERFSQNPNAISLLESHLDWVDWTMILLNPNAVDLILQNRERIILHQDWIVGNTNPKALVMIKELVQHNRNYSPAYLASNPLIFEIDQKKMQQKIKQFTDMLYSNIR